jgi:hypothetical protein
VESSDEDAAVSLQNECLQIFCAGFLVHVNPLIFALWRPVFDVTCSLSSIDFQDQAFTRDNRRLMQY